MKRIHLTVEGCSDCPYIRFHHGSKDVDAGWDCSLANKRVVDEGDRWDFSDSSPGEEGEELEMELEPVMRLCDIHLHPDWCPLPETE